MLRDLLLGSFATFNAGLFSQAPAFVQQYLQRLGGAISELERLAERTPRIHARIEQLHEAYDALKAAEPIGQPFIALAHLRPEIAVESFRDFEPVLPLSTSGLVYAVIGILLAVFLFNLVLWPFRERADTARSYS